MSDRTLKSQGRLYASLLSPKHGHANDADAAATPGNRCLLGGDYAGISVNLDNRGNLIPIPDLWVPASMVEWGQVPDYLETIVSEDSNRGQQWDRRVLTILPETGCAIDNLEVIKSQQSLETVALLEGSAACFSSAMSTAGIRKNPGAQSSWRLETLFDCDSITTPLHRIRVSVLVSREPPETNISESSAWKLSSSSTFASPAIQVAWERQFDASSSGGTLANGGGLDGRRVTGMIGPSIHKTSSKFGTTIMHSSDSDTSALFLDHGQDLVTLNLPGNLTLSYTTSIAAEAGGTLHIHLIHNEGTVSEVGEGTNYSRRSVHWALDFESRSPATAATVEAC